MTTHTSTLTNLYARLKTVGIDKAYVRRVVLPSWWEDEIATLPTGLLQLKMHLARHLGLDFDSVLDDNKPIIFAATGQCHFKRGIAIDEQELLQIKMLAAQAARIACLATTVEYQSLTINGSEIRQQILSQEATVSFPVLLDFCWKIGIPVLHLSEFPKKLKKQVQGMVVNIQEKPVIVLTKGNKKYAWQLFILAHELGHVVKHHVAPNEALLDSEITQTSVNQQETEANMFALELLTGKPNTAFNTEGRWLTAHQLAEAAKQYSELYHIDAGHIALNYGNSVVQSANGFGIANKALTILEPNVDAVKLIRDKMKKNLDFEQIPEDSAEFLLKISAISN